MKKSSLNAYFLDGIVLLYRFTLSSTDNIHLIISVFIAFYLFLATFILSHCFRTGCLGEYLELREGEVTGGWIKLHIEQLHNFVSSSYTLRVV
jgi:hypothetical protein